MAFADSLEQLKEFDFNNIEWQKIGVWPVPVKVMLCALIAALLFGGVYYFIVSDMNQTLEHQIQKEVTLKDSYRAKAFEAANLDAYRQQMVEMKSTFESLLSRLPTDTEVPGLLEDIDRQGAESGLVINEIKLQPEVAAEYYIELPISINVDGGYHDLGGFVSGVAGMPRIVTLHDYKIEFKKDSPILNMNITAKTYRYKAQE